MSDDDATMTVSIRALLQARTPGERYRCLRDHPALIGPDGVKEIAKLTAEQQDEDARGILLELGALLKRCAEIGVETALAEEATYDQAEIGRTAAAFLNAESWPESRDLLEQHLELLRPEVIAALEACAAEQEDGSRRLLVLEHCALLGRCRERGIVRAYRERDGWNSVETPPELETHVDVATWLKPRSTVEPGAARLLIQVLEHALERADADQYPAFRGALLHELGCAYFAFPGEDRSDNLQRAITWFNEALPLRRLHAEPFEFAMTLFSLGNTLLDLPSKEGRQERLDLAIACLLGSLDIWTPESASLDYARAQSALGSAYAAYPAADRRSWLGLAIACYEQALRFLTRDEHPDEHADIQLYLGECRRLRVVNHRGSNPAQLPRYTGEAQRRQRAALQVAASPVMESTFLPEAGAAEAELRLSIAHYEEALRWFRREGQTDNVALAEHGLGMAYAGRPDDRTANLLRAIEHYERALDLYLLSDAPRDRASVQLNLGAAYADLPVRDRSENLRQAIACYTDALQVFTLATHPEEYALACNNLGVAYTTLPTGDPVQNRRRAIAYLNEALRVYTPDSSPHDYAMIQSNLGNAHDGVTVGDRSAHIELAIAFYFDAARVRTREAAPYSYARTMNNLGGAYAQRAVGERTANLREAIACYRAALDVYTAEHDPSDYALAHANLANAELELPTDAAGSNSRRAIASCQEALRVFTKERYPVEYGWVQIALGQALLGLATFDAGRPVEAIRCFEEALRLFTLEAEPIAYATAQNNLGIALAGRGGDVRDEDAERAFRCFEEALRVFTREAAPHDARRAASNLGTLHFARQNWDAAAEAYDVAMDAGERMYRAGLSAASKSAEISQNAAIHRHAVIAAARLGDVERAWVIHERGKARLLFEALRLREPRPEGVPDSLWATFERAGASARVYLLPGVSPAEGARRTPEEHAAWADAARGAAAALDAVIGQIREHAPRFLRELDLVTLRAAIPDERTAMLSFCITEREAVALVLTRDPSEPPRAIDLPGVHPAWLEELVTSLHAGPDAPTDGGGDAWSSDVGRYRLILDRMLPEVGQKLIAPVLPSLPARIDRLVILPSGWLFLVPLHAALLPGEPVERLYERYEITYAPSVAVLSSLSERSSRPAGVGLYAVVNPEPSAKARLPFARVEGEAIAARFAEREVCSQQNATREAVEAGLRGRACIHFACHAAYSWDDPGQSSLSLADGRLTLDELQRGRMDLAAARLVTLSACQTGLTDVVRGVDEYVGLPAGFMLAGVPSVVSSLWSVSDFSTALLMDRFYCNYASGRMSAASALREAQGWVRDAPVGRVASYAEHCYRMSLPEDAAALLRLWRHYRLIAKRTPTVRPFEHPYYWGAFVVNGA
ncbi:CHAT domain-containing protein [Sorangium sp. So ce1153]|uniref:CHAT domain-containing protein n=1 Tax=Sorangium sp. So ce1153 TaxID=3133333 RepID=UPI003F5FC7A7